MTESASPGRRSRRGGRPASRRANELAGQVAADLIDRPTRRRAGVFRRAIRRETSRLRDRRRGIAVALLSLTFGVGAPGMIARGDAAGADAPAYWAGVRMWRYGVESD